jgi:NAD(P)-dependent dehydrogenase (short-subunit alcohol dehydrogenase family)
MTELLQGKTAIVCGGGGIGGGVARTFAREGAKVFLAGRMRETLDAVAKDITSAGGSAEAAVVDALDEQAVDEHVRAVAAETGTLSDEKIAGGRRRRRSDRADRRAGRHVGAAPDAQIGERRRGGSLSVASDRAAGMTGTIANVTAGLVLR